MVDFGTLLIGGEGAKTPAGDPGGVQRRGGSPHSPRKAQWLERKSTGKLTEPNKKAWNSKLFS